MTTPTVPVIRPRHADDRCSRAVGLTPAGKSRRCHRAATMRLDGLAYCDDHAAEIMTAACGRPVTITRKESAP